MKELLSPAYVQEQVLSDSKIAVAKFLLQAPAGWKFGFGSILEVTVVVNHAECSIEHSWNTKVSGRDGCYVSFSESHHDSNFKDVLQQFKNHVSSLCGEKSRTNADTTHLTHLTPAGSHNDDSLDPISLSTKSQQDGTHTMSSDGHPDERSTARQLTRDEKNDLAPRRSRDHALMPSLSSSEPSRSRTRNPSSSPTRRSPPPRHPRRGGRPASNPLPESPADAPLPESAIDAGSGAGGSPAAVPAWLAVARVAARICLEGISGLVASALRSAAAAAAGNRRPLAAAGPLPDARRLCAPPPPASVRGAPSPPRGR